MSASICCTFGRWTIHYPFRNGQSFDLTMDGVAAPRGQGPGDRRLHEEQKYVDEGRAQKGGRRFRRSYEMSMGRKWMEGEGIPHDTTILGTIQEERRAQEEKWEVRAPDRRAGGVLERATSPLHSGFLGQQVASKLHPSL